MSPRPRPPSATEAHRRWLQLVDTEGSVARCFRVRPSDRSSTSAAGTPLLMLVTMRGEWAEFNPWQVPMGQAAEAALRAIGVTVLRAETGEDLIEVTAQAAAMAFTPLSR